MTDQAPPGQQGYPGQQTPYSGNSDFNKRQFLIEQMLARVPGATLVQIKKVTTQGTVGPVGFVDVQPMVSMVDGQGNSSPHGVIHRIPYFRLQGGADKAIIMDPKVGDIGIAVFAGRDISKVKKTKKASPPGSFRRHDMADGLYIGGFLGETPKCYIQFTDDNKIVASPDEGVTKVTLEANKVKAQAGSLMIVLTPARIDLGEENAINAVQTTGGPSNYVFAKI